MADEIDRLRDEVDQLRTEKDTLAAEFHEHQLENANWRGQFALEVMQAVQKAIAAVPAEIDADRKKEAGIMERGWKTRKRIYEFLIAIGTLWLAFRPDIEAFIHHHHH